jgi:hypothetical protein
MKKGIFTLIISLLTIIITSAFVSLSSFGIAGYTGSPGEGNCNSCHSGGSSAAFGTSITAVPSFSANKFVPGTTYQITVQLAAAGFSRYGFGCEILDAKNNNVNSGLMQSAGDGVQFLSPSGRTNAVHTTPKSSAGIVSFSFGWKAPAAGAGDTATIYVAGNAVDGNGSTGGDFPMPPVRLQLKAQQSPVDTTIITAGPAEIKSIGISGISVYPNPASGLSSINYFLSQPQQILIELLSIDGKVVREFVNETQAAGSHAHFLDLQNITSGIYFVRTSIRNQKVSQQLIAIH